MNKREQQRKIKEEKELAAKQRQQTQKLIGKVALFGALPLLVLLALYTYFSQGRPTQRWRLPTMIT